MNTRAHKKYEIWKCSISHCYITYLLFSNNFVATYQDCYWISSITLFVTSMKSNVTKIHNLLPRSPRPFRSILNGFHSYSEAAPPVLQHQWQVPAQYICRCPFVLGFSHMKLFIIFFSKYMLLCIILATTHLTPIPWIIGCCLGFSSLFRQIPFFLRSR